MAKGSTPQNGSGKTRFSREKKSGESWIVARDRAIKEGRFSTRPSGSQKPSVVK